MSPAYHSYSATARRYEAMVERESRTGRRLPACAWGALVGRWWNVADQDIGPGLRQCAEDRRLDSMSRWVRALDGR